MKLVSGKANLVARNVSSLFKQQMQVELLARHPPRFELRASGFPFCALRSSYRKCLAKQGKFKTTENFGSMFYTSVGTAAHLAFQRWMGATGRIYGAWRCTCGGYKRFSNKNKCNICGKEMEYVEITVARGKYMTGHIDGIYRDIDGRWYVLDYKTSSVRNVEAAKKTPGKFPYYGNVCQIKAYCFDPSTYVVTDSGRVRIDVVCKNPSAYRVLSYNHATGVEEYKQVVASSEHSSDEDLFEIEYEGGVLRVTENHEVWSVTRSCYVKAKDLLEDEEILATHLG